MKKKWFRAMDLVDEKFIEEANPAQRVTPMRRKRIVTTLVASAACLALTLTSLWLFLPYDNTPPSIEQHKENPYYAVIEKLNALKKEESKYNNNFEMVEDVVTDALVGGVKGDAMEIAPGAAQNNSSMAPTRAPSDDGDRGSTYEEITDNQVEGITEADRIKRSSTHIFYLDGYTLRVFDIAGLDSKEVGYYRVNKYARSDDTSSWEFYLSEDCKTITIIAHYQNERNDPVVGVISVDVSDPAKPVEKGCVEIGGYYSSSRITNGKILLFARYWCQKDMINFNQEESFLPQINGQSIPADCIVLPENVNDTNYTVVMKLDESTLNIEGQSAFLSYSKNVYVSNDHIFLTHVYADTQKDGEYVVRNSMTEITCLTYKDSFEKKGTVVVRGYVKDQWSMDEYEGILRVVTTTNATKALEKYAHNYLYGDVLITATGDSNASLYCVDLKEFKVVASVEDFAPPREEVRSVRFDKTTAYVCTAIEVSDPVYFFDLSDLNNITYKETGTIDGFSSSLINIGNGYLLGIGREDWSTFKVEVYRETETGVEGYCKYTLKNVAYSQEYKSYYIDRENQLIGLGIWDGKTYYYLLHFDGYKLVPLLAVPINGEPEQLRGVYIDGFMYLFGENDFQVVNVKTGQTNKSTQTIEKIYDVAEQDNIPCDTGMEEFWKDGENTYYFSCIKSQYIKVVYWDGTSEDIVTALSNGHATIADLDRFQIEYYAKPHK